MGTPTGIEIRACRAQLEWSRGFDKAQQALQVAAVRIPPPHPAFSRILTARPHSSPDIMALQRGDIFVDLVGPEYGNE